MEFLNKSVPKILKMIIYSVIAVVAIYLLVSILPWVLITILVIWAAYKGIKFFNNNKSTNVQNQNIKENEEDKFTNNKNNIIDVEYQDVK